MRRDCMTLMALGLTLGSLLGGCADIRRRAEPWGTPLAT